jgi:hypothetical protein
MRKCEEKKCEILQSVAIVIVTNVFMISHIMLLCCGNSSLALLISPREFKTCFEIIK